MFISFSFWDLFASTRRITIWDLIERQRKSAKMPYETNSKWISPFFRTQSHSEIVTWVYIIPGTGSMWIGNVHMIKYCVCVRDYILSICRETVVQNATRDCSAKIQSVLHVQYDILSIIQCHKWIWGSLSPLLIHTYNSKQKDLSN